VQPSECRDVSSIVDAREQRYGGFDPVRGARDDLRGRSVYVRNVQPEFFEHEYTDGVVLG
jgi:hypothetical protein